MNREAWPVIQPGIAYCARGCAVFPDCATHHDARYDHAVT